MIAKPITLLIAFAIVFMEAKQLFQIESRFKERQSQLQKIAIPDTLTQTTLQEQLSLYAQIHESPQFKHFKADPEYSAQMLLKKNGLWSQSVYFTGRQVNNLLMQITVIHKGDQHNHDKDAITVYLINTGTNEFLFAGKVKHMKLFKYQVQSQLYELKVGFDWSKEAERNITTEQQVMKHIAINIDIDPIVPQQTKQKDEEAAQTKIRIIKSETDRIFMTSLQIWNEIHNHHDQFFKNQEEVYLRAYFQLVIVFAANCIEWLLLRKTLKLKPII